jgi:hypothetical protein
MPLPDWFWEDEPTNLGEMFEELRRIIKSSNFAKVMYGGQGQVIGTITNWSPTGRRTTSMAFQTRDPSVVPGKTTGKITFDYVQADLDAIKRMIDMGIMTEKEALALGRP